jgi:hypothetical protein
MARRPELNGGNARARVREVWELECLRRGCGGCPDGAYIGPGGEGERHPGGHGHQWPSALFAIKRGKGLRGETAD